MQEYKCPNCGHVSSYDPWTESARCPECGHAPDQGIAIRGRLSKPSTGAHQPFLDELLAHWDGSHSPDTAFTIETPDLAVLFFQDYQRALGEDPFLGTGGHARYIRNYHPSKEEILDFVGAFLLLRRGKREAAARRLRDLNLLSPKFADPWIWRTATIDDPGERREYLENALLNEPAHPLARDAMAVTRGALDGITEEMASPGLPRLLSIRCSGCGGSLHYKAGESDVLCPYCGQRVPLERSDVLEQEAPLLGDLQLQRRYQRYIWKEVQRIAHCQSCAAMLTMTKHLAKRCPFCGSSNVLIEDNRAEFQQPDGFLPFWVFDGFVEIRTWASSMAAPTPAGGSTPLSDQIMFDNLLYSGLKTPEPELLAKILPFKSEDMVGYEPRLLADWPAALYQLDVERAVEDIYDQMIQMAQLQAPPLISPAAQERTTRPTAFRRSFQVSGMSYQLVLMPVWIQWVQEGDRQRLALVNGQTSKVALGKGESPREEEHP